MTALTATALARWAVDQHLTEDQAARFASMASPEMRRFLAERYGRGDSTEQMAADSMRMRMALSQLDPTDATSVRKFSSVHRDGLAEVHTADNCQACAQRAASWRGSRATAEYSAFVDESFNAHNREI